MKKLSIIKIISIFLLSFIVISSFEGCKKSKENKLVGIWKLVPETEPVEGQINTWTFYDGDRVERITATDTLVAEYSVVSENLEYYLQINNGFDVIDRNGKYKINKLSKDILKITRFENVNGERVFNRLEFVKE